MRALLRASFLFVGLNTLLFGVGYPALVTGIARVAFPAQAQGSLISDGGTVRGSRLIGQHFEAPGHLWSRPSATVPMPYNAAASSGSNLGPSNPALHDAVRDRIARLGVAGPVPADLVTASGSGLDPHVSPAAAQLQVPRIAAARGMPPEAVQAIIDEHTEGRLLGLFGEPRVNVLEVNLALESGAAAAAR